MKAIVLGLMLALVGTVSAAEFEDVRITPQICNYVETATLVSTAKIASGNSDEAIDAWADHEIKANYSVNKELYVAWSMVREATAFIRNAYDSDNINDLAKVLPRYTKGELVGVRMKQLCAANEAKGVSFKVQKQQSTRIDT